MKQTIKKIAASLAVLPLLALGVTAVAAPTTVSAACSANDYSISAGAECAQGNDTPDSLTGSTGVFQSIVNVLLFLVGAISVIMLIIGGIRYVISSGDQTQVTAAKNTILYAIVGIIVAFLAYAAVDFVIGFLADNSN